MLVTANATYVSVRVSLVLGSCAVSTLGNLFVLVIFSRIAGRGVRHRIVDIILAALAFTALARALLLGPVQATCFITGDIYILYEIPKVVFFFGILNLTFTKPIEEI